MKRKLAFRKRNKPTPSVSRPVVIEVPKSRLRPLGEDVPGNPKGGRTERRRTNDDVSMTIASAEEATDVSQDRDDKHLKWTC